MTRLTGSGCCGESAWNRPPEARVSGRGCSGPPWICWPGLGARQVILYVDDDAPDDDPERSRAAAATVYERAGFVEVGRLWSYQLTR